MASHRQEIPAIATADRMRLAIQESGRLGSFLPERRAIALRVLLSGHHGNEAATAGRVEVLHQRLATWPRPVSSSIRRIASPSE